MSAKKRTRLSPNARRMQLLDCAATYIQENGLSSFTMEALANEAGVSNPLIYKYFDTRLELLQELLSREHTRYSTEINKRLEGAETYEQITRIFVISNFDEARRGNILSILRNQPDIHTAIASAEEKQRTRAGKFLVEKLAEIYPMTPAQAEQFVVMGSGASQMMAARYARSRHSKKKLIDDTVKFIIGGIENYLS